MYELLELAHCHLAICKVSPPLEPYSPIDHCSIVLSTVAYGDMPFIANVSYRYSPDFVGVLFPAHIYVAIDYSGIGIGSA